MRRFLLVTGSILVSIVLMIAVLNGQPLDEIWENMRQADLFWLTLSFFMVIIALWSRAVRWVGMLPGYSLSITDSLYIIGVTFTLNLLPLRAGEVARSFLATRHGVPFMTAAASVVIERLLDTLVVVVVLLLSLSNVPSIPPETSRAMLIFGVLAIVGFIVLLIFARYKSVPRWILKQVLVILPFLKRLPLEKLLENGLDGLEPLTHWRLFVHTIVWTLISWGLSLVTMWLVFKSMNITDVDMVVSSALAMTLASLSAAIPLSVASVGPIEAAIVLSGQLSGIDDVRALSLGFVFHGVTTLGYLALGIVSFFKLQINATELISQATHQQPDDETQN